MKIIIIDKFCNPKEPADRKFGMLKVFAGLGHDVTLIRAEYKNSGFLSKGYSRETVFDVDVYSVFTKPSDGTSKGKLKSILSFKKSFKRRMKRIIKRIKAEVIITFSNSPFEAEAIFDWIINDRFDRSRLYYYIDELWPLFIVEKTDLSAVHKTLEKMQTSEDITYNKYTGFISEIEFAGSHIRGRGYTTDGKYLNAKYHINTFFHKECMQPSKEIYAMFNRLREDNKFIVGALEDEHSAEEIKTLIKAIVSTPKDARYIIICDEHRAEYEQLADELEVSKYIDFLDRGNGQYVDSTLKRCDAVYYGVKSHSLHRLGFVSYGLLQSMIASRPMIYTVDGSDDIVRQAKAGITSVPGEEEFVSQAIQYLMFQNPIVLSAMGNAGYEYVRDNHDIALVASKVLEFITPEEKKKIEDEEAEVVIGE